MPENSNITFTEWTFLTDNASFFKIADSTFEQLVVVFGEEEIHWSFYQNYPVMKQVTGSAVLPVCFCSCCLVRQYKNIAKVIVNYTQERLGYALKNSGFDEELAAALLEPSIPPPPITTEEEPDYETLVYRQEHCCSR